MTPEDRKRAHELIHAYELGMVSAVDREWLERLMMDDDELFQKFDALREVSGILRNDADVPRLIADIVAEHDRKQRELKRAHGSSRRVWTTLIPITVLFLLVLILKDWHFSVSPTDPVFADEVRLIVIPFRVLEPDSLYPHFGKIISNLLISDLLESKRLQVISKEGMDDIAHTADTGGIDRPIDDAIRTIANKTRVKWLVRGDVVATQPNVIVNLQIVDVENGMVLSGNTITDGTYKDVFSLVDSMTVIIRSHLLPPDNLKRENDPRIAEVTTYSPDAYFAYIEGLSLFERYYNDDAIRRFERAIEYDSTFAMAYYYLARLKNRAYLDKAMHYIDNAGTRDRFYIRSLDAANRGDSREYMNELLSLAERFPDEKYAYFSMAEIYYGQRNYPETILNLKKALEIDSLYKNAYNLLAYAYDASEDLENAIVAINTYISLAPDEPNPYDTRADLYAKNGHLDNAIQSYRKALEIKPDFHASLHKLGSMYLYSGRYAEADSCYALVIKGNDGNPVARLTEELYRCLIPYHRGKLEKAVEAFDSLIAKYSRELPATRPSSVVRLKAFAQLRQQRFHDARRTFEEFMLMNKEAFPNALINDRHFYVHILAESQDFDSGAGVLHRMRIDLDSLADNNYQYWYALGALDFYRENYNGAVLNFEKAFELNQQMPTAYMLGRSYLNAGILDKAVGLFESQLKIYDESWRICLADWGILEHYYLAIAYQESRWTDKAIGELSTFLRLWKDCDEGIEEVEDARRRLTELTGKS